MGPRGCCRNQRRRLPGPGSSSRKLPIACGPQLGLASRRNTQTACTTMLTAATLYSCAPGQPQHGAFSCCRSRAGAAPPGPRSQVASTHRQSIETAQPPSMPAAAAAIASSLAAAPARPWPRQRVQTSRKRSSPRAAAWQRRHGMSGGAPLPPGRRSQEALPLFPADASPTMASLKHRVGQGSLGDVTVPHALADERGGGGGAAPTGGLSGLAPLVLLCVAVASMGAFSFGYALGVVNGPLGALSSSLGFGGDAFRQGLVSDSGWLRGGWRCSGGRCAPVLVVAHRNCDLSALRDPQSH